MTQATQKLQGGLRLLLVLESCGGEVGGLLRAVQIAALQIQRCDQIGLLDVLSLLREAATEAPDRTRFQALPQQLQQGGDRCLALAIRQYAQPDGAFEGAHHSRSGQLSAAPEPGGREAGQGPAAKAAWPVRSPAHPEAGSVIHKGATRVIRCQKQAQGRGVIHGQINQSLLLWGRKTGYALYRMMKRR